MDWAVGVEFYKNETEKEMDGAFLLSFEVEDNASDDKIRETVTKIIKTILISTSKVEKTEEFLEAMNGGLGKVDTAHALAFMLAKSEKGYRNIVRIVEHDTYWFHVFVKDEMARQRKSMFEKSVDELESETTERSFEEIMGEDLGSGDKKSGNSLSFTTDFYFSKTGEELNGLPDFWAIKAGLV